MNPLTQVKNLQKITARETAAGVSDDGSWHARYKNSAYIFTGGLPFDLTEGDVLSVFAQYGEIVDLNLVRDKGTGKSKGYAFVAYEDQRSTVLAVDNLNGAKVLGRILKVDHVLDYKRKIQEDEEEEQKKREERGVCYNFQRGECTRGSSCRFSHDEQRNANTGWGPGAGGSKGDRGADGPRWGHDRYEQGRTSDRSDNARQTDGDRRRRPDDQRVRDFESRRPRFDSNGRSQYEDRAARGSNPRRDDDGRAGDDRHGNARRDDDGRAGDDRHGNARRDDDGRAGDDRRGRGSDNGKAKNDKEVDGDESKDDDGRRSKYVSKRPRDDSRGDEDNDHGSNISRAGKTGGQHRWKGEGGSVVERDQGSD